MRAVTLLLALLAFGGCAQPERPPPGLAGVARDARGEPIIAAPGAAPAKVESCAHKRRCP